MKPYEFLDHTADIKVVARGKNLAKAFENAAIATFEVMTDTTKIQPNMTKTIEIENEKLTTLLYDFIDELIFLMDTQAFLLKHCKNTTLTKQETNTYKLQTTLFGDIQKNTDQYDVTSYIKSPTYNEMSIEQKKRHYKITFVPDI